MCFLFVPQLHSILSFLEHLLLSVCRAVIICSPINLVVVRYGLMVLILSYRKSLIFLSFFIKRQNGETFKRFLSNQSIFMRI